MQTKQLGWDYDSVLGGPLVPEGDAFNIYRRSPFLNNSSRRILFYLLMYRAESIPYMHMMFNKIEQRSK